VPSEFLDLLAVGLPLAIEQDHRHLARFYIDG